MDSDSPKGPPKAQPGPAPKRRTRAGAKQTDAVRGRVRAHDPFELIRWLAMSQPDPRKALAELVQNSLDAGARRIRITRLRERGQICLKIHDDGEGVIPDLDRTEALRYIATHIGHSRKRSLSPQERLALMTQGQYGIGLLGFWSLGQQLEMRTSVPGQGAHRLVLYRDRPDFLITPIHGRLPLDELWTEVVVVGVHREALAVLGGRRAADYLASELRGQLLAREVEVTVEDRISRGRAPKSVLVRPPRFLGERLQELGTIAVENHPPIRMEIYLTGDTAADEGGHRGIGLYAAGTLVAEGFDELSALGLDREPWIDPRLTGMVDFAGFHVAPGNRRGIAVDEAASAFVRALSAGAEPVLRAILERFERERAVEMDRTLIRDLQRAFRDFHRQRPRFAMLPVASGGNSEGGVGGNSEGGVGGESDPGAVGGAAEPEAPAGASRGEVAGEEATVEVPEERSRADGTVTLETAPLFPPGPVASVEIVPAKIRIECSARRRVHARCFDSSGRAVEESVTFEWSLTPEVGTIQTPEDIPAGGPEIAIQASEHPAEGRVSVLARGESGASAIAEAPVEILEEILRGNASEGIPEPEFVDQPGSLWRSRMLDERWQVNAGHRDFRAIADRPALKLRYLATLFAKEIVLRSHQDPRLEKPLEQLAEIAAYADRNLTTGRRGRRKKESE